MRKNDNANCEWLKSIRNEDQVSRYWCGYINTKMGLYTPHSGNTYQTYANVICDEIDVQHIYTLLKLLSIDVHPSKSAYGQYVFRITCDPLVNTLRELGLSDRLRERSLWIEHESSLINDYRRRWCNSFEFLLGIIDASAQYNVAKQRLSIHCAYNVMKPIVDAFIQDGLHLSDTQFTLHGKRGDKCVMAFVGAEVSNFLSLMEYGSPDNGSPISPSGIALLKLLNADFRIVK